jgi:tetrapyrrole methylase family protein/MazG family protein
VPWLELDRLRPDHLTSLWIPELAAPVGQELIRLEELVRILRQQCPWDRAQTHVSLRRHLMEESYEVLDAIDSGDSEHLEEELGDLLFQVYLHAALAAEDGEFTLADVARGIHDKLVGRHPHVFGPGAATTAGEAELNWELIKRQEKSRDSVLDGIPVALPALLHAQKVQGKAAAVGFDWENADGAWPKVEEEIAETRHAVATGGDVEDELGDLLFACVNVARHLGVDAEGALRRATAKFGDRFRGVERLAAERGLSLAGADLATLDAIWDEVKAGVPPVA